jgi:hypothetical protein
MKSFLGRALFLFAGLAVAVFSRNFISSARFDAPRFPAAIPQGRLDFRALDIDAVPRAVTARVMAEAKVTETAQGPQLILGHFRSTLADGSTLELCETYGSVEATFEGLGQVADGAEPIRLKVRYPCRQSGGNGNTTLTAIAIPIGQLGQTKPHPTELNWNDAGEIVSLQVRGEADIWPEIFTLKEIRLVGSRKNTDTIVLDRGLIARQTKSPLDFRMFTATRTAGD